MTDAPPRIAVVTVVHGRHHHLQAQQRSLARSAVLVDDYVVVAMDDPWPARWRTTFPPAPHVVEIDGTADGLPLAAARNLGARTAIGRGADLLVFLDVDCLASPGLALAYDQASRRPGCGDALLCGPVAYLPPAPPGGYDLHTVESLGAPHPSRPAPLPGAVELDPEGHRLFWSLSFAVTPATWDRVGGFDEAYVGYGGEDTDFAQRAAAAGVPVAWVGGARASHQHHPTQDPPVQHVADIVRNGRLFRDRWGWWPMEGWISAFAALGLVRVDASGDVHLV
jgi:GT2 family glycosyltransferase